MKRLISMALLAASTLACAKDKPKAKDISPKEVEPFVEQRPVYHLVSFCPTGYQLVRWHEHFEQSLATTVTAIYNVDAPSGYYRVPDDDVPAKATPHPDKCVIKDMTK